MLPEPAVEPPRVVVLVEGESDAVVVRILAAERGLADGVEVRPMGGVTNLRRDLALARADHPDAEVLVLYDAAETSAVVRALRQSGQHLSLGADLTRLGCFGCEADLEDELIRALGTDVVEQELHEMRHLTRFRGMQQQPAWRGRDLRDQLHSFFGNRSGRKLALCARLAVRLDDATIPPPLAALLDRVEQLKASHGPPPWGG